MKFVVGKCEKFIAICILLQGIVTKLTLAKKSDFGSNYFWFLTSQWCEAVKSAGCHLPLEWSSSLAFLQHMDANFHIGKKNPNAVKNLIKEFLSSFALT